MFLRHQDLFLVVPQTQPVESSDAQVAKLYICEINHLFLSWSLIIQMPLKLSILFVAASLLNLLFTHLSFIHPNIHVCEIKLSAMGG